MELTSLIEDPETMSVRQVVAEAMVARGGGSTSRGGSAGAAPGAGTLQELQVHLPIRGSLSFA